MTSYPLRSEDERWKSYSLAIFRVPLLFFAKFRVLDGSSMQFRAFPKEPSMNDDFCYEKKMLEQRMSLWVMPAR